MIWCLHNLHLCIRSVISRKGAIINHSETYKRYSSIAWMCSRKTTTVCYQGQKLSADWLWVKVSRVHYHFKKEDEYIFVHLLFWANMQRRHDRNIFSMNNCGCDMYLGIWSDRSYFGLFGTYQIFSAIHDSSWLRHIAIRIYSYTC